MKGNIASALVGGLLAVTAALVSAQTSTSCPYAAGNPTPVPTVINGKSDCVPDLLLGNLMANERD